MYVEKNLPHTAKCYRKLSPGIEPLIFPTQSVNANHLTSLSFMLSKVIIKQSFANLRHIFGCRH